MPFAQDPPASAALRSSLRRTAEMREHDDELVNHLRFRAAGECDRQTPDLVHDSLQSSRHIRLLNLSPGTLEDPIYCTLSQIHVDSPDAVYVALSYTWGDPEHRLPIQCNDATASITVNLYSALLRLRKVDVKQVLWIDALCINQGTDHDALWERAGQIRMMDSIFSRAEMVLVDLGGAEAERSRKVREILAPMEEISHKDSLSDQDWSAAVEPLLSVDDDSIFLMLLEDFILRPWFGRVWVVQEFVVARHVEFMLGTVTIHMDILRCIKPVVEEYFARRLEIGRTATLPLATRTFDLSNVIAFLGLLHNTRRFRQVFDQRLSFPLVLQFGARCHASDKRDRIYGMLGLLDESISSEIHVDYSESDSKLEQRLAKLLIEHGFLLDCLTRAKGPNQKTASWTPSLISSKVVDEPSTMQHEESYHLYRACGSESPYAHVTDDWATLVTKAVRVDTVQFISLPNKSYDARVGKLVSLTPKNMAGWYNYVRRWVDKHFKEWNSTVRHRVLWQTFSWDRVVGSEEFERRSRSPIEIDADRTPMEEYFRSASSSNGPESPPLDLVPQYQRLFDSISMRICRTGRGRMALVPEKAVHGTEIWIIPGVEVPFVLRRIDHGHILVGPCYVHGIMDGEALDLSPLNVEELHIK